jgi:hypothetical protein
MKDAQDVSTRNTKLTNLRLRYECYYTLALQVECACVYEHCEKAQHVQSGSKSAPLPGN